MRENRNALAAIMQGAEACEQFGHRVFGSHRFVAPFGQARREQNRTEKHWKDQNRAEQNYKTALETAERPGLGFGQENFAFCNLYACSVEFFFSFLFVYFFFLWHEIRVVHLAPRTDTWDAASRGKSSRVFGVASGQPESQTTKTKTTHDRPNENINFKFPY